MENVFLLRLLVISSFITLNHVFYTLHLSFNLLSVAQLVDNNCIISFSCSGYDATCICTCWNVIFVKDRLFQLHCVSLP